MKEIYFEKIVDSIEKLSMEANYFLCRDILDGLKNGLKREISPIGKNVLDTLIKNAEISKNNQVAMCQDTGMAIVFIEIGQDVHIKGGSLTEAVNEGVRRGYEKGFLRKSVVKDPIDRINTGDNTPAVIHYEIVEGDSLKITFVPKGFGSENMSRLKMLKPSDGIEGVKDFIIETVKLAGPNPCPPIVVGVGVGGSFEKAAILSKKALLRNIENQNENNFWKNIEQELLIEINNLGIGPAGLGGIITALSVNIETYPTHIAGLPVAVNISCNATRHKEVEL